MNHAVILFFTLFALVPPSFAIQGGKLAPEHSSLTSAVVSLGALNPGHHPTFFCSGVLVSPHAIVTAAHCLYGKNANQTVVLFGANGNTTPVQRLGNWITIPSQYRPYTSRLPLARMNYDIAVLRFDGGVPDGFHPAVLQTDDFKPGADPHYYIAGFGAPTSGILSACEVTMLNPNWSQSEFELHSSPHCTPDVGDSGGPVYRVEGETIRVFGIHNWGWHDEHKQPNMSVEAQISYYAPWIVQLSQ